MKKLVSIIGLTVGILTQQTSDVYYVYFDSEDYQTCSVEDGDGRYLAVSKFIKREDTKGTRGYEICGSELFWVIEEQTSDRLVSQDSISNISFISATELRSIFQKKHLNDLKLMRAGELKQHDFLKDVQIMIVEKIDSNSFRVNPVKWMFLKPID